jgi:hypothetical protein
MIYRSNIRPVEKRSRIGGFALLIGVAVACGSEPARVTDDAGSSVAVGDAEASADSGRSTDGNAKPIDYPSWRVGMPPYSWKKLPTSNLSDLKPSPDVAAGGSPDVNGLEMLGGLSGRIEAWVGLAADTVNNRIYSAANGGHADYAGNEVYELDLLQAEPTWVMLRAPSPTNVIYRGNYNLGIYPDYYRDGRPGSTHSYYAMHFLPSKGAIYRFGSGSLYGSGNEGNNKIDAFDIARRDWDTAGSHPDITPTRTDAINISICRNPENDSVYVAAAGALRRYDAATNRVTALAAAWPQNYTAVKGRACAFDPVRKQLVFFGDAYKTPSGGFVYDTVADSLREIVFSGTATNASISWQEAYAYYDSAVGAFLMKVNAPGVIVRVDPVTFDASVLPTTGADAQSEATNGVQTRFLHLPGLGGYAYYPPKRTDSVWFLATQ